MMSMSNGIPIEHFLLSTGLTVRLAGTFDGEHCNINAILTKDGKPAELRNGHLLTSAVGFASMERRHMPRVEAALDELVKVISEKTIWFGDDSLKVPKLSTNAMKVLRGSGSVDTREVHCVNPADEV